MDWNLGALITLGISLASAIVWIIRLEGRVKILESELQGERGINNTLNKIEQKQELQMNMLVEIKTQLTNLIQDHNRKTNVCRDYKSNAIEG